MDKNLVITLRTKHTMPSLGLGTWQLTKDTTDTNIKALELGYTLIDTSSDYGTQPGIGLGIMESHFSREDVYLVTKVEETDNAYQRTQQNLEELNTDFIDLTLIHRPPPMGSGEDLWQGLIKAKKEGLTKDIGVSNYSIQQIDQLIKTSGQVPVVNQIEWSPFGYSQEMMAYCQEKNIVIQAYSPLTRAKRLDHNSLRKVAQKHGKTPAQILIRWSLQSGACPIPKANQTKHLQENLDVFNFKLNQHDMSTLNDLNEGYSSFGEPLPYA